MRLHGSSSHPAEEFLSGAYRRIRRITVVLAAINAAVMALLFGWRSGIGAMTGAFVGYLNLIWLHHGATMTVERIIAPGEKTSARSRLLLSFAGRYIFLMAIAYVIFKSSPSMLLGFTVALFLPIAAAICEGIYEAIVNVKAEETTNE